MFVAVNGNEKNGFDYIGEALKNGAAAVVAYEEAELPVPLIKVPDIREMTAKLAKRFYFPQKSNFKLIGVTGTNGKTTVTHIIKDILESLDKNVGVIGTNGIFINGREEMFCKNTPTTPNSLELWQIFAAMAKKDVEYAVMEVSSHALFLKRVLGCEFDAGVFTNLTRDHLDFHKDMEQYLLAKEKLFDLCKVGVINIDDTAGAKIYGNIKIPKMSVGFNDADLSVRGLAVNDVGSEFFADFRNETEYARISLPGRFNVYNALFAVGACVAVGIDFKSAVRGLGFAKPVTGRMERVKTDKDFSVIIDYAHSPDSLEKVIHTVKGFAKGRVITLFGCGGDRDKSKRALMGEVAGRFSDYTIITSDNPRTENPVEIIKDIFEGIKKTNGKFTIIPNRKAAIEYALSAAQKDDVVLLAGKGQETYQIIGKEKVYFDERKIVTEYINKNEKG